MCRHSGDYEYYSHRPTNESRQSIVAPPTDMLSQLIGKRCEMTMAIGGIQTKCLIDSGSQVSTLSAEFHQKYLLHDSPLHALDSLDSLVHIEAANGSTIPYLGYIRADVNVTSKLVMQLVHCSSCALIQTTLIPFQWC